MFYLRYAFQAGATVDEVYHSTGIDPWFLDNIRQIVEYENELRELAGTEKTL
jgi:carbamoyl-phosphate synthase large subunit